MTTQTIELENGARATVTIEPAPTVDLHISFKSMPGATVVATVSAAVAKSILEEYGGDFARGAYRKADGSLLLIDFTDVLYID